MIQSTGSEVVNLVCFCNKFNFSFYDKASKSVTTDLRNCEGLFTYQEGMKSVFHIPENVTEVGL
jgi:hypothetical protein